MKPLDRNEKDFTRMARATKALRRGIAELTESLETVDLDEAGDIREMMHRCKNLRDSVALLEMVLERRCFDLMGVEGAK